MITTTRGFHLKSCVCPRRASVKSENASSHVFGPGPFKFLALRILGPDQFELLCIAGRRKIRELGILRAFSTISNIPYEMQLDACASLRAMEGQQGSLCCFRRCPTESDREDGWRFGTTECSIDSAALFQLHDSLLALLRPPLEGKVSSGAMTGILSSQEQMSEMGE
ncbi:hypothetical protein BKA80DRAFT_87791 [Phyllosticta citrichinensis]